MDNAWSNYYSYKQGQKQTLHNYLKASKSQVNVLKHYGPAIGTSKPFLDAVNKDTMEVTTTEAKAIDILALSTATARKKFIAIAFLH